MDWWKKKKKQSFDKKRALFLFRKRGEMLFHDLIKCCNGISNPIKFFSAELILEATDDFSIANHFSGLRSYRCDWYLGMNNNYSMTLIKKFVLKLDKYNSGFCRDIVISSMVSGHRNFMKLVGCCLELEDPLIVYYGENKQHSLIDFEKIISWKRRMKIAEDIATALAYLHTAFPRPFVYRSMNIAKILIDEDGIAKLSDLSCCISIPVGETFVKVDEIAGASAYIDKNYRNNHIVSEKTDAYGFGRVMLILLMGEGRKIDDISREYCSDDDDDDYMYGWISKFIEEGRLIDEIADPKMGEVIEEERCGLNAFLLLTERCFSLKGEVPTMVEVAKELKKIQRS